MTEHIVSWSYSKYGDFARCKLAAKLKHIDRVPEPERELRPGQTEHANDRGSRIHDECEQFVRGTGAFPKEMREFEPEMNQLRHLFKLGKVFLEGEWAQDRDWEITDWKTGWLRLKLDAMVRISKTMAVVIDYKTGRKFGNEVKHAEQLQLYALVTFLRHSELDELWAELWYPDAKDLTSVHFTRDQALRFLRVWTRRGDDVTTCTVWPANPNIYTCQWCGYGPWGTKDCTVGVRKTK